MLRSLLLIVAACLVVSCSDENPAAPQTPRIAIPAPGSMFEISQHRMDSQGTMLPRSASSFTMVISATNMSIGGRSGVWTAIRYRDSVSEASDTTYLCLDGRGNLLMSEGDDLSADGPSWYRFPLTAGQQILDTASYDIVSEGTPLRLTLISRTSYTSDEPIDIGGSLVPTLRFDTWYKLSAAALGQHLDSTTIAATRWFAPSLGVFVRSSFAAYEFDGEANAGVYRSVTKYSLR